MAAVGADDRPVLRSWQLGVLLLVGPVLLAVAGLFHPSPLTADSAQQWRTLHVVMLALFPLLAVTIWVLLRGERSVLAHAARLAAYVYACFYTALDVLAGIANGAIVEYGAASGSDVDAVKAVVFGQGDEVLAVGTWAMIAACLLTGLVYLRRVGARALPGTVVLLVSAWSFRDSHVYPPRGVITMLGFGLGAVLLAWPAIRQRARAIPDVG